MLGHSRPLGVNVSRIEDRNIYPNTDALYNPLRKVLLNPVQVMSHQPYLNPAAATSRVTRDFAFISDVDAMHLRQNTLIPIDKQLVATQNFDKVRNYRFMVVDAQQRVIGPPISPEQLQRIRLRGLKQQRIVYDFGRPAQPPPPVILPPRQQTKIIRQQVRSSYVPPPIDDYRTQNKYKYNLFSMIDQQANGEGCGCPNNQIIASRNDPTSINWLN